MGDNIAANSSLSVNMAHSQERVSTYLRDLESKRQALLLVREEPQTPPRSPRDEVGRDERIQAVRERAQDAWTKAHGNPADGRWAVLTDILRLSVTCGRGGRWMGARTDIPSAKPLVNGDGDAYWINAETESEWREWETRDSEERKIREKVESWKKKLEAQQTVSSVVIPASEHISMASTSGLNQPPAITPKSSQNKSPHRVKVATMKTAGAVPKGVARTSSLTSALKDNSALGFSVVKRQKPITGKPGRNSLSHPVHLPTSSHTDPEQNTHSQPEHLPSPPKRHNIADVTEMSFLPPSFPSSAIVTSTPKPKSNAKSSTARKPDPIPRATSVPEPVSVPFPLLSTPIPSPLATNARKSPLETTTSLSALPCPSTPPRQPIHSSVHKPNRDPTTNHETNANNKRPATPQADAEDSRALKKARTLPTLTTMGPPSPRALKSIPRATPAPPSSSPQTPPPVTPKKQAIPTLRELLASRKKGKGKAALVSPNFIVRGASRAKNDGSSTSLDPVKQVVDPPSADALLRQSPPRAPSPLPPKAPVIDPYADDADFDAILAAPPAKGSQDIYHNIFDPYADDVALDSPTKSLSSLAGSDSEEDSDHDDAPAHAAFGPLSSGFAFHPPITSTQGGPLPKGKTQLTDSWSSVYGAASPGKGGAAPPSSGGMPVYNSQFEAAVARDVDTVDQLLERDTIYEGWLRDPTPEPQPGMAMDDSP